MPDNLTWEELKDAGESLIAPGADGPITSFDHRTYNLMMISYAISFNDFMVYLNADGEAIDDRLYKRLVSKVTISPDSTVIAEDYLDKPFLSKTLKFINGVQYAPGTKVTISFKQDPYAP